MAAASVCQVRAETLGTNSFRWAFDSGFDGFLVLHVCQEELGTNR